MCLAMNGSLCVHSFVFVQRAAENCVPFAPFMGLREPPRSQHSGDDHKWAGAKQRNKCLAVDGSLCVHCFVFAQRAAENCAPFAPCVGLREPPRSQHSGDDRKWAGAKQRNKCLAVDGSLCVHSFVQAVAGCCVVVE